MTWPLYGYGYRRYFIESFYPVYTILYCILLEGVTQQLNLLLFTLLQDRTFVLWAYLPYTPGVAQQIVSVSHKDKSWMLGDVYFWDWFRGDWWVGRQGPTRPASWNGRLLAPSNLFTHENAFDHYVGTSQNSALNKGKMMYVNCACEVAILYVRKWLSFRVISWICKALPSGQKIKFFF